jgi:UDP-glucose 4-epimerase
MDWKGRRVLINGVTGFIGSNLARELFNKGAIIYSIDNFSYIDADMAKRKLDFLKDVVIIEGDVSTKEPWLRVPWDIEYIFHFAAPSSITLFKRDPEKCLKETKFGLYWALEFAKHHRIKKLVYPSTGSLYAGNEMPHSEKIYPKPRNLYAAAKISCEGLANCYSDFVNSVGLRIFAGYGPGEEWKKDFGSVLYLFINDYMNGRPPVVWGDGGQTRDFVYVDDVVQMILNAAETDYEGVVNIGTGRSSSFSELIQIIKEVLGTDIDPEYIPKETGYIENLEAETTLMKQVLKVEPQSPREGIRKFIDYLKNNNDF